MISPMRLWSRVPLPYGPPSPRPPLAAYVVRIGDAHRAPGRTTVNPSSMGRSLAFITCVQAICERDTLNHEVRPKHQPSFVLIFSHTDHTHTYWQETHTPYSRRPALSLRCSQDTALRCSQRRSHLPACMWGLAEHSNTRLVTRAHALYILVLAVARPKCRCM